MLFCFFVFLASWSGDGGSSDRPRSTSEPKRPRFSPRAPGYGVMMLRCHGYVDSALPRSFSVAMPPVAEAESLPDVTDPQPPDPIPAIPWCGTPELCPKHLENQGKRKNACGGA